MKRWAMSVLLVCGAAAPLGGQQVDTAAAIAALREFDAVCAGHGERLWGRDLCGPVVLVYAPTRLAVALRRDPAGSWRPHAGAWVGTLPDGVLTANTAFDLGGERWSMVLLPLPEDRFDRLRLLGHEAFHRIQPLLGLEGPDRASAHLDERDARLWLRLELRALAAALRAPDEALARAHARDAMLFRARRRASWPQAAEAEAALELQEGLPQYTGARLALDVMAIEPARAAAIVEGYDDHDAYARALGYATGAALGLLLDRFAPDWRARAASEPMSSMLAQAVGAGPVECATLLQRAAQYGHDDVAREESARAEAREARLAGYRARFIEAETIVLPPRNLMMSFDPNTLAPFGEHGTVYPTGSFRADWGSLEVTGGALVTPGVEIVLESPSAISADARTVDGPGWKLHLAEGWRLRRVEDGWTVVH